MSAVHWNGTLGRGSQEIFLDFRSQLSEAHADAYIIYDFVGHPEGMGRLPKGKASVP